jgi:hypothetical protein
VEEYEALATLHMSLLRRPRPEDVAQLVIDALPGKLRFRQRRTLRRVAGSASRARRTPTPNADFSEPIGGAHQVAAAKRLFALPATEVDTDDPAALLAFARQAGAPIHAAPPKLDFLEDRLDRAERAAAGIELSKRQYNRQFRVLRRIAAKASTVDRLLAQRERATPARRGLALVAQAGLTASISWDRFEADPDAACFVAYYTAREKSGAHKVYDPAADMLFRRCSGKPGTDWWMIAQAYAPPEVLGKLSDVELAEFVARARALLRETRWTAPEHTGHDQGLS